MADSAALLVDEVLPHRPMRQWVFSVPFPLRFLFASRPAIMGKVLGIVYRTIATHLSRKAGYTKTTSNTGAVTLIQPKLPKPEPAVVRNRVWMPAESPAFPLR